MSQRFYEHWITETLRLRESLWGPFEDSAEAGLARATEGDFPKRVAHRARLLAQREGLDTVVQRWRQAARIVLIAFMVLAVLAGASAAAGALGNGTRPVNLAMAIMGLLGLNLLTLVLWGLSFAMRGGDTGSLLADAWLNLTRKLARGPDAALAPRALLEILSRQKATRWCAGVLGHGVWVIALVSCLATLMALLAVRRYSFQWETTLLSPDTYVWIVHALGALPSLLGFPQPSADIVRASGNVQSLPESAQALWSGWLLGVVAVYGLAPRIAALAISVILSRRRLSRMTVDASLPGIAELHDRLMPPSVSTGVDAPAPQPVLPGTGRHAGRVETGRRCVLGVELPEDVAGPLLEAVRNAPSTSHEASDRDTPSGITDLGVIDTREQRRQVLDALRSRPAERLLVACDARQTPDRGTSALLSELRALSQAMQVCLLPEGTEARRAQWQKLLLQTGFEPDQIADSTHAGMTWLMEDRNREAPST